MRYPMENDPTRMLVTSDLHYGLYPDGDAATKELAGFVCDSGADVFAICGDVGDSDAASFQACLELFGDFSGLKLVVPGNHDLWSAARPSSEKYREILPSIAVDAGFRMLDVGPVTAARTGFIGTIGWYDYTFRNPDLNVPMKQYRGKELPGVCSWNDGRFIHWDMTDEEFTEKCLRKLHSSYRSVEPGVHTVVAVLHVVPFKELLYGASTAAYEFSRAYLGSEQLGAALRQMPKVRYTFCGHRHGPDRCVFDSMSAFCVGSEYRRKRLLDLQLESGECMTHVFEPECKDE